MPAAASRGLDAWSCALPCHPCPCQLQHQCRFRGFVTAGHCTCHIVTKNWETLCEGRGFNGGEHGLWIISAVLSFLSCFQWHTQCGSNCRYERAHRYERGTCFPVIHGLPCCARHLFLPCFTCFAPFYTLNHGSIAHVHVHVRCHSTIC